MSLPDIRRTVELFATRLFRIEEVHLSFANGEQRVYERLPATGEPAVMVVAVLATAVDATADAHAGDKNDNSSVSQGDELVLIREYAAGFHEEQLTLPKGSALVGESLEEAANRELAEETGFAARSMQFIKQLTLAPGHMGFTINVMLARDLYPHVLPADEPQAPEVVRWPVARLDELLVCDDFNEARAIAALALARRILLPTTQGAHKGAHKNAQ